MEVSRMMHMDGAGWLWSMWVGGLLFWGSLIAFGVWAIRRFTDRPRRNEARRVLEDRFARGEIDAEEFGRRTRVLEGDES
jgi:putative membrane protein